MAYMKYLIIILAGVFLIACSGTASKQSNQAEILNDTWVLVSIGGEEIHIDPENDGIETPRLEIIASEMKYTGSDGCNNFMGGLVVLDDEHLKFGIAAGTRRMCMEMKIPDQFNQSLTLVNSYKITRQVLHLYSADGVQILQLGKNQ